MSGWYEDALEKKRQAQIRWLYIKLASKIAFWVLVVFCLVKFLFW